MEQTHKTFKAIVIDWLQLNCVFKVVTGDDGKPVPYGWNDGFDVKPSQYRTKHWKKVEFISFQDGRLISTACSESVHAWVRSDMVQIKFENDFLYQHNLIDEVEAFLQLNNLELISISRVDIAMDFTAFWSEQNFGRYSNPEKLIQDFNRDKVLHVGRCAFAVDGSELLKNFIQVEDVEKTESMLKKLIEDLHKGKTIIGKYKVRGIVTSRKENNYLRFGNMNSDVAAYIYNKTEQMKLVNKPWIKENWDANGYDGKRDVWRLEISFKGAVKEFCFMDDEIPVKVKMKIAKGKKAAKLKRPVLRYNFKSLDILRHDVLSDLYYCAVDRYFSFCKNENLRNKGRFKRIKLFDYKLPSAVIIDKTDKLESNRMHKIFVRMMDDTARELRGTADDLAAMCSDVKQYYIWKRGMNENKSKSIN